jgi:hypothetical protein
MKISLLSRKLFNLLLILVVMTLIISQLGWAVNNASASLVSSPADADAATFTFKDNMARLQGSHSDQDIVEFPVPTFADVPFDYSVMYGGVIYYLHDTIQALYEAGYTAGCSKEPLSFCPDKTLTRVEAAVFMLRGLLGISYTPPTDPGGYVFQDDWSSSLNSWGQPWAEGMWDEGLTAGCSADPLLFCPLSTFTRAEASVFGLRIENGAGYTPPAASHIFADDWSDPSISWAEAWAEQAYLDGLFPACGEYDGKPLFCPADQVTRAWAAYVVVQAKDLPIPWPIPGYPRLTLTVTQSPLTVYPPIMIYTAQLSYVPPAPSTQFKVDFFNLSWTGWEYLGSAIVNPKGEAVLSKQMHAGKYTAIARVVINSRSIWSNAVTYKVP